VVGVTPERRQTVFLSYQPRGANGRKRWRGWLRKFFAALFAPLPAFPPRPSFKPELEDLENRLVPAGSITAVLGADQVLRIQGTDQADTILVQQQNNKLSIAGVSIQSGKQQLVSVAAAQVKEIVINTGAGDEYAAIAPQITIPAELFAGSGNDTLSGGGGNETLNGGSGMDVLEAGGGNDVLYAGSGSTTLSGGAGNDTLWGGSGADVLQSGGGATVLHASTGDDTLFGGPGRDTLYGGPGKDHLFGGSGNELLLAGSGDNQLVAGSGNDTLYAGAGNDTLWAGAGTDVLYGGPGNTMLVGDAGTATLYGGPGNDTLFGGTGNDVLIAGKGNSFLQAGSGNDLLQAGPGNCTLIGGAGNDTLSAGTGNDQLFGGSGNVTLQGGSGNDTLYGGTGSNTFKPGTGFTTFYDHFDLKHPTKGPAQSADILQGNTPLTKGIDQAIAEGMTIHGIDWAKRIKKDPKTADGYLVYLHGLSSPPIEVLFNGTWTSNDAQPLDPAGHQTGEYWALLVQRAYLETVSVNVFTLAPSSKTPTGWNQLSTALRLLYG